MPKRKHRHKSLERDEEGRFTSEGNTGHGGGPRYSRSSRDEDDYGRPSSSRDSRYYGEDEDDDEDYTSRARGGWNDAREEQDSDEGYDYGSRSRSGLRRGRDQGGWYGQTEDYPQTARGGWEGDERGWYGGDPEASAQGERREREATYREQGRGRRSEYENESYADSRSGARGSRSGGGRGHGGWHGDTERHSEASRQRGRH